MNTHHLWAINDDEDPQRLRSYLSDWVTLSCHFPISLCILGTRQENNWSEASALRSLQRVIGLEGWQNRCFHPLWIIRENNRAALQFLYHILTRCPFRAPFTTSTLPVSASVLCGRNMAPSLWSKSEAGSGLWKVQRTIRVRSHLDESSGVETHLRETHND